MGLSAHKWSAPAVMVSPATMFSHPEMVSPAETVSPAEMVSRAAEIVSHMRAHVLKVQSSFDRPAL